ncbi:MAG: HEAT repeat domain-containing protein, partial [Deltaproteobacteria bacterium]
RAACARALGDAARHGYAGRAAYWEVVKRVADRDERVRAAAAFASAALGRERFARELFRLRKETSPVVLAALAEGLAFVPGPEALARLVELARHADPAVRRAAIAALGSRPEADARALLAAAIGDDDPVVRARAVGAVDDPDALRALLGDDDDRVRAAAVAQLVARVGRAGAAADAAALLADAASPAERAAVAGAWLATRR